MKAGLLTIDYRLQRERHALNALLKPVAIPRMQQQRPGLYQEAHVDAKVIGPSQQDILKLVEGGCEAKQSRVTAVEGRLSQVRQLLMPSIDRLAAEVQEVELYRRAGDEVSSRVLEICAARLEEQDVRKRNNNAQAGRPELWAVLGALSRLEMRG